VKTRHQAHPKEPCFRTSQPMWAVSPSSGADADASYRVNEQGYYEEVKTGASPMRMPADRVWHLMQKIHPGEASGVCIVCGFRFRLTYLKWGRDRYAPRFSAKGYHCKLCAKELEVED